MKKTLVVIIIIILGGCGYLYYDWHTKTKKQAAERVSRSIHGRMPREHSTSPTDRHPKVRPTSRRPRVTNTQNGPW